MEIFSIYIVRYHGKSFHLLTLLDKFIFMKNKVFILFIFIFILVSDAYPETIDGPANVRDNPNGEIAFKLFDNVQVEAKEPEGEWYFIGVWAILTEKQFNSDTLKHGTPLYNESGDRIGTTIKNLPLFGTYMDGGDNTLLITGYTYKNNIRPDSIVENQLNKILKSNINNFNISKFKNHLNKFKYYKLEERLFIDGPIDMYMVYESEVVDPSPTDRIRLFSQNNELIAIYHTRRISLNGYKRFQIEGFGEVILLKYSNEVKKAKYIESISRQFWGRD